MHTLIALLTRLTPRRHRYPDTVLIGQACELPLGKDRFMLRGVAYSLTQKTIVAVSHQDCVTYDYQALKKCDIPHDIRTALQAKGIPASQNP